MAILLLGGCESGRKASVSARTTVPARAPEPAPELPPLTEAELESVLAPARADAEAGGMVPFLTLAYTNDDVPTYETLVTFLNAHPRLTRVRIAVHSDPRGSAEYNLRLTQDRADAVAHALVRRGIDCHRIEPVGYGESRPIADAPMAAQRRAELVFIRVDHTDVIEPASDACPG